MTSKRSARFASFATAKPVPWLAAEPDVEELTLQPEPAPLRTPLPTSQAARPPIPALGKHEQDPSLAGLAAADGNFSADLGAIGAGNLSLSTLDGRTGDTEPPPIAGMPSAPPPTPQVASSHDVVSLDSRDLASAPLPHPGSSDANRFAPPTVEGHEEELTLAFDPAIDGPPGGQSAPVAAVVESAPHATQTMAPEPPPQRTMAPEPGQQAEHSQRQTLSPEVSTDSSPPKPSIGARFSEFVVSMRGGLAARGSRRICHWGRHRNAVRVSHRPRRWRNPRDQCVSASPQGTARQLRRSNR